MGWYSIHVLFSVFYDNKPVPLTQNPGDLTDPDPSPNPDPVGGSGTFRSSVFSLLGAKVPTDNPGAKVPGVTGRSIPRHQTIPGLKQG